jgi:DNA-binding IclR family transcriptional regulator
MNGEAMKEKSYKRIEAVRKAGEILKHLGQMKGPSTGPEIATAIGLASGTAMCHLATLEDLGFVQRVGDYWRIGTGLALIWARVKSNLEGEKMLIEANLKELEEGGDV